MAHKAHRFRNFCLREFLHDFTLKFVSGYAEKKIVKLMSLFVGFFASEGLKSTRGDPDLRRGRVRSGRSK
jgi:hypothetical protein